MRRWVAQRDELAQRVALLRSDKVVNRFRLHGGGSNCLFAEGVDEALMAYFKELRAKLAPVSTRMLVRKWAQLDPVAVNSISHNAARHRMYRFMRRNNISVRSVTHQAQNRHESLEGSYVVAGCR